jgi:hypothetical protein
VAVVSLLSEVATAGAWLLFFKGFQFIQAAEEEQVGNLFDDFKRVGDAASPEGVPDGVDLTANFRL